MMQCRIAIAELALLVVLIGAAATGARELDETRWRDNAYGLSLRPPVGTQLIEQTGDTYLVRILDRQGRFQIAASVKRSRKALTMNETVTSITEQMYHAQPTVSRTEPENRQVAGREAAVMYFTYPQPAKGPDVVVGYCVVRMDAKSFAVLELHCSTEEGETHRAMFKKVIGSMELADQRELAKQRAKAIERATQWLGRTRSPEKMKELRARLRDSQYFRIVDGTQDIGYMRIHQATETIDLRSKNQQGIRVEIQSRLVKSDRSTIDTLAKFFLSDDDTTELWTVATTLRQPAPNRPEPIKQTFTETGLRSGMNINITVNGPRGAEQLQFEQPKRGYLSQVEAKLLPLMMPADRAATYGFYWYNSATNKMTYRTEQVTPTLNGFVITTRLGPNAPALRATYNAERLLVEQQLGAERKLVASDKQTILRLWRHR